MELKLSRWKEEYAEAFKALSLEWLEKYVEVEPRDLETIEHPHEVILDRGGMIWLALADGVPVGTVSILREEGGDWELAKMAVTEAYKGRGISRLLMDAALAYAAEIGAETLTLFTNSALIPAIGLYHSYGFRDVPVTGAAYATSDRKMELTLQPRTWSVQTERLALQPLSADALEKLIAETPEEDLRQAYGEMRAAAMQDPENRNWYVPWEILRKRDGVAAGYLGFRGPAENGAVEIGYGTLPGYEGCGYATEAAEAAVDWALKCPGVSAVEAEAEADNAASLRVLEKLRFVRCGTGEEGPRFVRTNEN